LNPQSNQQQQTPAAPAVQHHQHSGLEHYQQQRHQQLHYQQQEARLPQHQQQKPSPHRRMLRWLFNAHSRSPAALTVPVIHAASGQQQLSPQHRNNGLQQQSSLLEEPLQELQHL